MQPGEFRLTRTVSLTDTETMTVSYAGRWAKGHGWTGIEFRCDEPGDGLTLQRWHGPFTMDEISMMFDHSPSHEEESVVTTN